MEKNITVSTHSTFLYTYRLENVKSTQAVDEILQAQPNNDSDEQYSKCCISQVCVTFSFVGALLIGDVHVLNLRPTTMYWKHKILCHHFK